MTAPQTTPTGAHPQWGNPYVTGTAWAPPAHAPITRKDTGRLDRLVQWARREPLLIVGLAVGAGLLLAALFGAQGRR